MFNLTPKPKPDEALMDFSVAIGEVMKGHKITRKSWNDVNEYGVLADGWLTIHTKGVFNKWLVNSGDLEGIDWKVC